jgi:UDP-N-acetylglucosamine 2-epimerase (non-hydrolysing)/GDP/UDP-N,N'-diacetylbacillosamine 2-epimerase (hydrolysing)
MIKIFIITERRADYSRFKPILDLIIKDKDLDYSLAVTGAHIKPEMGNTIDEIINDGFNIDFKIEMFTEDMDTSGSMVRAFSRVVHDVTYCLEEVKPNLILSGFDIGANLAVTIAGAHMNIPVAHIQGGEVTGTIDESIRHAMSKFSHYHFAANKDSVDRLIKMGEEPHHVFNVGCPSIDAIKQVNDNPGILKKYSLTNKNFFILIQHPVTTEPEKSTSQIVTTLQALKKANINVIIILPNNDAGFSNIIREVKSSNFKYIETLSISDYINLLKRSIGLIGNSSSGIHETATFNIPTINIGSRQNKRLRPNNVIDVDHNEIQILKAIRKCLKSKDENKKFFNPYGDGDSALKIISIIKNLDLSNNIIQKTITY